MGKYTSLIILLVLNCATISCAVHTPSRNSMFTVMGDQKACDETHSDADKCRSRKVSNDMFMVFWTIDYGYRLNPPNDLDTIINPEFDGEGVEQEFNQFFSTQNLGLTVGKKIYCDCVGERYERDGAFFYKIRKAHLFAK